MTLKRCLFVRSLDLVATTLSQKHNFQTWKWVHFCKNWPKHCIVSTLIFVDTRNCCKLPIISCSPDLTTNSKFRFFRSFYKFVKRFDQKNPKEDSFSLFKKCIEHNLDFGIRCWIQWTSQKTDFAISRICLRNLSEKCDLF